MPGNLVFSQGMFGTSKKREASFGSVFGLMSSWMIGRGAGAAMGSSSARLWPFTVHRAPSRRKPPGRKTDSDVCTLRLRAGARRDASHSGQRLLVSSTSYPSKQTAGAKEAVAAIGHRQTTRAVVGRG